MYMMRNVRTTALTSLAVAVLLAFAAGPATAGHGLTMKEHPLRGDFPVENGNGPSMIVQDAATADPATVAGQGDEPGGWLRGDFPLADVSPAEQASPETERAGPNGVVTLGAGETWWCTVHTADARDAGSGPAQSVVRIIHLPQ